MSEIQPSSDDGAERLAAAAAFGTADRADTFGPSFFLGHLGRFVLKHCPDASEKLPMVQISLGDGETLLEAFNVFNQPQCFWAGSVGGNVRSPTFGRITSAASPRLVQLAAKFVF